jgi:hypothetical protein
MFPLRRDKKFCSPQCRNVFWARERRELEEMGKKVKEGGEKREE